MKRIPDVLIRKAPSTSAGAPAVQRQGDAPVVLAVEPVEVQEAYLEILDRYAGMKVVTVIELVSPSNKARRAGRRFYRAKQRETLAGERCILLRSICFGAAVTC